METSQTTKAIATALMRFQVDAPNVTKDAKANYGRYATLGNVIESMRKHLFEFGLSFSQMPDGDGLTTIIMHESGEWIKATSTLKLDKQTPQGQGSAITYMRRYALSAALGIATEDDDDGNEPSTPRHTTQKPATATKPAPTKTEATIRLAADKDRLKALLAMYGHEEELSVKQVKDAVFGLTGFALSNDNIAEVNETLSAKLEAKEAQE